MILLSFKATTSTPPLPPSTTYTFTMSRSTLILTTVTPTPTPTPSTAVPPTSGIYFIPLCRIIDTAPFRIHVHSYIMWPGSVNWVGFHDRVKIIWTISLRIQVRAEIFLSQSLKICSFGSYLEDFFFSLGWAIPASHRLHVENV